MSSNGSDNLPTQGHEEETLLEFPCEFPIKAFGAADEDFDALVVSLVRKHVPDLGDSSVQKRFSNAGRFVSVTVTITARSREQLDAIYQELTNEERVMMAL